jgi:ABC-2 type transport system ATP-binding protein
VGIIDRGRMVACDTPNELTAGAAGDEITFTASAGLAVGELARCLGLLPSAVRELRPGDYLVEVAATPERVAGITAWLAERGALLGELRAGRKSLEDVFLRLTTEGRS